MKWVLVNIPNINCRCSLIPVATSAKREVIRCEPIPGPNGTIRYVQDWVDLTHFG